MLELIYYLKNLQNLTIIIFFDLINQLFIKYFIIKIYFNINNIKSILIKKFCKNLNFL